MTDKLQELEDVVRSMLKTPDGIKIFDHMRICITADDVNLGYPSEKEPDGYCWTRFKTLNEMLEKIKEFTAHDQRGL